MKFLNIPFRNLKRRRLRTLFTIIGISIAISSAVLLISMSRGIEKAWVNSLTERNVHILGLGSETIEILTSTLDENLKTELKNVPGIRNVSGELVNLVGLKNGFHAIQRGWAKNSFLWNTIQLTEGELPGPGDLNKILIGPTVSKKMNIKTGDSIQILKKTFVVSGISIPAGTMNNSAMIFHLKTLQKLIDKSGKVTEFHIQVNHPENIELVKEIQLKLNKAFPKILFMQTKEVAEKNDILIIFKNITWAISLISLIVALFFILNTLLMSVSERTKEIGILNALGWSQNRIILMIILEGVILVSIATVIGYFLGVISLKWLVKLPRLDGIFEPEVSKFMFIEIFLITLLLGIIGSLYPALKAARLNPVDALNQE
jgi:putative ABC transport system permease protein